MWSSKQTLEQYTVKALLWVLSNYCHLKGATEDTHEASEWENRPDLQTKKAERRAGCSPISLPNAASSISISMTLRLPPHTLIVGSYQSAILGIVWVMQARTVLNNALIFQIRSTNDVYKWLSISKAISWPIRTNVAISNDRMICLNPSDG